MEPVHSTNHQSLTPTLRYGGEASLLGGRIPQKMNFHVDRVSMVVTWRKINFYDQLQCLNSPIWPMMSLLFWKTLQILLLCSLLMVCVWSASFTLKKFHCADMFVCLWRYWLMIYVIKPFIVCHIVTGWKLKCHKDTKHKDVIVFCFRLTKQTVDTGVIDGFLCLWHLRFAPGHFGMTSRGHWCLTFSSPSVWDKNW